MLQHPVVHSAFLLSGLLLLATSTRIVLDFFGLILTLPVQARQLFNEMLYSNSYSAAAHMLLVGLIILFWHVAYVALVIYLIIGAPYLLRRDIRRHFAY